MTRKTIAVLGLGVFGRTIARELTQFDQDVIVADHDERHIAAVADLVSKAAIGDITNIAFLRSLGIDQCDTAIVATGTDLESAALAVMNCKKLGIGYIVAKAKSQAYEEVLYGIGADLVVSPERETAKHLVSKILRHKIQGIFHFEDGISLIEFAIPDSWVGKSIVTLKLRQTFQMNVIGLRTQAKTPLQTSIDPNQALTQGTVIVAIADTRLFEQYDYLDYLN